MAHVGIQRLGAGHAEENAAQHQETGIAIGEQEYQAIDRVERNQDRRVQQDAPYAKHGYAQKP